MLEEQALDRRRQQDSLALLYQLHFNQLKTMITIFKIKVKQIVTLLFFAAIINAVGCKKGTFDINSPNPNSLSPSTVAPKYYLSSSLAGTANLMFGGTSLAFTGPDILNTWMGYWAYSGGYTPSPVLVTYQLTSTVGTGNWDNAYLNLKNYNVIQTLSSADPNLANYKGISLIMQSFVFQRVVDLYNDAPYKEAFSSATNTTPAYDKGSDIYRSLISNIDTAVLTIKAAQANTNAENPGNFDVMFKGHMDKWIKFANTVKLKLLMRLTETADGPAFITSNLSGLTAADFLGAGEDAGVNPGYSTASNLQENPYYLDVAYTVTGAAGTNTNYWRAGNYGVNFYNNNNDPRANYFYAPDKAGKIQGRKIGSTAGNEGNDNISGVNGQGNAKSPSQDAVILGAFESFFLQAEAAQRGYLQGDAKDLYKKAVEQSFSLLGVTDAMTAADTYITQPGNSNVNYATSADKLKTLITQKWAACNSFDALESFSDWRRLKIPADLPVSDYPGNQAPHIPYRLLYPESESSYNSAQFKKEGNIDVLTSKIFWQP